MVARTKIYKDWYKFASLLLCDRNIHHVFRTMGVCFSIICFEYNQALSAFDNFVIEFEKRTFEGRSFSRYILTEHRFLLFVANITISFRDSKSLRDIEDLTHFFIFSFFKSTLSSFTRLMLQDYLHLKSKSFEKTFLFAEQLNCNDQNDFCE